MLRLAQERDGLMVIDDQLGAPTSAEPLAGITTLAIQHVQQHPEHASLYHLVAGDETSWLEHEKCVLAQEQLAQQAIKINAT